VATLYVHDIVIPALIAGSRRVGFRTLAVVVLVMTVRA